MAEFHEFFNRVSGNGASISITTTWRNERLEYGVVFTLPSNQLRNFHDNAVQQSSCLQCR